LLIGGQSIGYKNPKAKQVLYATGNNGNDKKEIEMVKKVSTGRCRGC
jgi:hypothetical protein